MIYPRFFAQELYHPEEDPVLQINVSLQTEK
jgi:hypothetical protein